jgi:2-amino-4-hydroxy-6-hydroxymethyldihydropteridine diphosphokinase
MLHAAVEKLQAPDLRLTRVSGMYETAPVGYLDQPWFLNQVAEFDSALSPCELLARARSVENEMGRVRTFVNGPRNIDIDLILCGDAVVATEDLIVPHPRYRERRFVLKPLLELNPNLRDPATGERLADVLKELPAA